MSAALPALVEQIAQRLLAQRLCLASAESCTGGLIAAACTEVAGASDWFERGYVSYSNVAKHEMLGVNLQLIEQEGAVSQAVAAAMALGARQSVTRPAWAVAVTGIAGPGGGSVGKPVGTVWIAWADPSAQVRTEVFSFAGDRARVREQTCVAALEGLLRAL